jgi:hypothetical protein
MKYNLVRAWLLIATFCFAGMLPLEAQCSPASVAGNWAYTYTGTIFTNAGPLPAASVGHFKLDRSGNINGGQTFTLAGQTEAEDIRGNLTVNGDCTGTATVEVFVNGQSQRTTTLAVIFDNNANHTRAIFQSVVLPNGIHLPVVVTFDGSRIATRD